MTNSTEALIDAAKHLCDEELTPARAHVVFKAMGHHQSIPFKNYPALEAMLSNDKTAFDDLARKTTVIMKHYSWSYETFLKALWYHDSKRSQVTE